MLRRRRVGPRRLLILSAVLAAVVLPMLVASGDDGVVSPAGVGEVATTTTAAPQPVTFARVGAVELLLPAEQVLLVGFHEAALPAALELRPQGTLLSNENPTKFTPPADGPGPGYIVLSSRGRRHPATSAADLVLRDGTPVRSPVSGTVTDVRPYLLYGRYDDVRIEIAPDAAPELRVVLIHLDGPAVRAGDRVEAGRTVLAEGPNRFPFASHIDRYFPVERWPHVHIEVKAAG